MKNTNAHGSRNCARTSHGSAADNLEFRRPVALLARLPLLRLLRRSQTPRSEVRSSEENSRIITSILHGTLRHSLHMSVCCLTTQADNPPLATVLHNCLSLNRPRHTIGSRKTRADPHPHRRHASPANSGAHAPTNVHPTSKKIASASSLAVFKARSKSPSVTWALPTIDIQW